MPCPQIPTTSRAEIHDRGLDSRAEGPDLNPTKSESSVTLDSEVPLPSRDQAFVPRELSSKDILDDNSSAGIRTIWVKDVCASTCLTWIYDQFFRLESAIFEEASWPAIPSNCLAKLQHEKSFVISCVVTEQMWNEES